MTAEKPLVQAHTLPELRPADMETVPTESAAPLTPPAVEAMDAAPTPITESATSFMSKLDTLRPSTWAIRGVVKFQSRRAEADPAALTSRLREHKVGRLLFDATTITTVMLAGRLASSAAKGFLLTKGYAVSGGDVHITDNLRIVPMGMEIPDEDQKLLTSPSPSASASASPTHSPSASPSISHSPSHSPSPEVSTSSSKSASPTPTPSKSSATSTPTPSASSTSPSASPSASHNQANTPTGYGAAAEGNQAEPGLTAYKGAQPATTESFGSKTTTTEVIFSKDAQTISRGEGWYHQFNDMGIDEKHHHKLLQEVGPELKKRGLAYYDKSHGEWRMNFANVVTDEHGRKHGVIKSKDLAFIYEHAATKGYVKPEQLTLPDLESHIVAKPGDNLVEVADRSLNSYGIDVDDTKLHDAFVTNVMGDEKFMKMLNDAHMIKLGSDGKPVLENGVPVIDTAKLEAAKNGTYILPDAVKHEMQLRIQEIFKDVQADIDGTTEDARDTRREAARAGIVTHTTTATPSATPTPSASASHGISSPSATPTPEAEATHQGHSTTVKVLGVVAGASVLVAGGTLVHTVRKRRATRPHTPTPPAGPSTGSRRKRVLAERH